MDPCRLGHVERATKVNVEHRVDEVGSHVVERLVAQDACVVDDDVDLAERIDRGLHDCGAAFGGGNAVGVGNCLAARSADFVDDKVSGALVAAGAIDRTTEVVDHDEGATRRHQECMLAAKATACASNDCYLAVKSNVAHNERS